MTSDDHAIIHAHGATLDPDSRFFSLDHTSEVSFSPRGKELYRGVRLMYRPLTERVSDVADPRACDSKSC